MNFKYLKKIVNYFNNIYLIFRFIFNSKIGQDYNINFLQKIKLIIKIIKNNKKIKSLTKWQQHLLLIEEIFKIPKSLKGVIVECGCYKGAVTANLSLACALTNRKLIVCDSFNGIPRPKKNEKYEVINSTDYYIWEKGQFKSTLSEVKKNVINFGEINVCRFVKGYFDDTLKNIDIDSIVLIFEDVDLASSVKSCLKYLWSKLQNGCSFYSHEPWSMSVVSLFFDKKWWKKNFKIDPPGFYGFRSGIKVGFIYTSLGYARKFNVKKIIKYGKHVITPY